MLLNPEDRATMLNIGKLLVFGIIVMLALIAVSNIFF